MSSASQEFAQGYITDRVADLLRQEGYDHAMVELGETRAIGDNLNDVEMLDYAGTAYVMGNAIESLKSRGYRQAATNDEGGLASAIRACLADS